MLNIQKMITLNSETVTGRNEQTNWKLLMHH